MIGTYAKQVAEDTRQGYGPVVGMGATLYINSSRFAYTIIEVSKTGKSFKMQRDIAIRTDNNGMSDLQDYEYKADSNGAIVTVRLNKWGQYRATGGYRIKYGVRNAFDEYTF